jgi:hypothetical protein
MLFKRILAMTPEEAEYNSIQLFASPRALAPDSHWGKLLRTVASRGLISTFCIDEAHNVSLQAHFRPEFLTAATFMKELYDLQPEKAPFIAMSATFRREDQDALSTHLGMQPTYVEWTDMDRRRIFFDVQVSGSPATSIRTSVDFDYKTDRNIKTIVYTNSKRKAEETLAPMAEKILETHGIDGEVLPLTGDSGIMEKMFIMEGFAKPFDAEYDEFVPNFIIMPATSAANCGVGCKDCHRGYRLGPPPTMHDHAQEMGRVDRNQNRRAGFNRYEVHTDFHSFLSQWVRAMQNRDSGVRNRFIRCFYDVNSILFTPDRCYHILFEEYFENDAVHVDRQPCEHYCSFCTGAYKEMTGLFRRDRLTNILLTKFLVGSMNAKSLLAFLKSEKDNYFAEGSVPNRQVGPIHALAIQLVCKGSIIPTVDDKFHNLIGTENLKSNHIIFKAGVRQENGVVVPIVNTDGAWESLNCI